MEEILKDIERLDYTYGIIMKEKVMLAVRTKEEFEENLLSFLSEIYSQEKQGYISRSVTIEYFNNLLSILSILK